MRLFYPFFFDPFDSKFDFLNKDLIFYIFIAEISSTSTDPTSYFGGIEYWEDQV